MPPLPVVPQVCKIEVGGQFHDSPWFNIYYVEYTGSAPSSANLSSYLSAITSVVETQYGLNMSVDNETTSIKGTDLTTDTGAVAEVSFSSFGVRTGDFLPSSAALVATCEITRRYRGGHPRKYLPWGTAGTLASGSSRDWDSGFVTACASSFATMLSGMIGITEGGTTWATNVNVSYRSGGVVRSSAVVDPIVGIRIAPRICSQRRRLGKVGG
jgi:hypothetical protein